MIFQQYAPSKTLEPFVVGYLEADSSANGEMTVHTLFPNGFSGIFFNFGKLGKLSIKQEYETPTVSLFGQIDQCFEAIHWPGSYSLGVLLKPTALSKLLREDMSQFTNKTNDACFLAPSLKSLYTQLEETPLTKNKIALLDNHFTHAFLGIQNTFTITDAALHLIDHHAFLSIKALAANLKISERHLEVQFKRHIGLSPKTYSLISRFKRMEQKLQENPSLPWGQMDFAHEYYDQNHFIKDFKRFTGNTPSEYLLNNFEMGRSYLLK